MPKYDGHNGTNFQLGSLFNPLDPFSSKPDLGILSWSSGDNGPVVPTGGNINLKYYEVTEHQAYYHALSIDMALEARWGLSKGSASLNFSKDISIDDRSFSLVLTVEKTYNKEETRGKLELGAVGKQALSRALNTNNIDLLPVLTGTEVIKSITKGSRISVIYYVKCSSTSSKSKLLAHLGAKWNAGTASMNFSQEMKSIDNEASLQIEINHVGANLAQESLAEITRNPNDLALVRDIIINELKKANYEHAAVLMADTVYLHENMIDFIFPEQDPAKGPSIVEAYQRAIQKVKFCDDLNLQLFPYLMQIEEYNNIAQEIRTNRYIGIKEGAQEKIVEYLKELDDKKAQLKNLYNDSLKANLNNFPVLLTKVSSLVIPRIKIADYLIMPQVTFVGWNNDHDIRVDRRGHTEFFDFHADVSLILGIKNIKLIKYVEIYNSGKLCSSISPEQLKSIQNNLGDTYKIWSQQYHEYNVYGWGHECHYGPEIKDRIRKTSQPEYESKNNYTLKSYLIDGSEYTINLGDLKSPAKSHAEHLDVNPHSLLSHILADDVNLTDAQKSTLGIWPTLRFFTPLTITPPKEDKTAIASMPADTANTTMPLNREDSKDETVKPSIGK